jgi:hypothetical protein
MAANDTRRQTCLRNKARVPGQVGRGASNPVIVLLLVFALLVSGCSLIGRGGSSTLRLGTEADLVDQATLVCSRQCEERGQCGSSEAGQMVLLSSVTPVVTGHDVASVTDTTVTVLWQQVETVMEISSSRTIEVPFYLVEVPGRGPAWVAGWCVGQ